jgi:hypothetical protein
MTKRPIDIVRESGGSFSIANPEDGTAITGMFTYSDFLLVLTEKCAYKIQTADQVDPKRLNPNLPKVIQQKLFDYGTRSEIVGRTLLTAKGLFRERFLPDWVDLERGIKLSFEALSEIVAMKTASLEFKELEDRAISQAEEVGAKTDRLCFRRSVTLKPSARRSLKRRITPELSCLKFQNCSTQVPNGADGGISRISFTRHSANKMTSRN